MRIQFSKIALAAFATIATTAPQAQPQEQHQPPQVQCECQCPLQKEYKYQYQYQYPPQQEQPQRRIVNNEKRREVQKLIEDGFEKNKREILVEALHLSPTDIEILYEVNKMNAISYAVLSGTIGFGVGSYIQGDMIFGIAQTALDVLGLSFAIADNFSVSAKIRAVYIMGISRIAGLIAPFVYQYRYNKELKEVLNGNGISYSIDPLIVPKDGVPAVGLAFNLWIH